MLNSMLVCSISSAYPFANYHYHILYITSDIKNRLDCTHMFDEHFHRGHYFACR